MKILNFEIATAELNEGNEMFKELLLSPLESYEDDFVKEGLAHADAAMFREPSLATYVLTLKEPPIEHIRFILWNFWNEAPGEIKIKTNEKGILYFPAYGYLQAKPNTNYSVQKSTGNGLIFYNETEKITQLESPYQLAGSAIKLLKHKVPYLADIAKLELARDISDTYEIYKETVNDALNFIKLQNNDLFKAIECTTAEIQIYDETTTNSFASVYSNGSAFINLEHKLQNALFFIDDLSHQCGHTIFNNLTLNTSRFLRLHQNTPMSDLSGLSTDTRPIYGAFHGLFTFTCMLSSLDAYINHWPNDNDTIQEAYARIGFCMSKMKQDFGFLFNAAYFTKEGMQYVDMMYASYLDIYGKYKNTLLNYHYNNQPYNFSYQDFCIGNNLAYNRS